LKEKHRKEKQSSGSVTAKQVSYRLSFVGRFYLGNFGPRTRVNFDWRKEHDWTVRIGNSVACGMRSRRFLSILQAERSRKSEQTSVSAVSRKNGEK